MHFFFFMSTNLSHRSHEGVNPSASFIPKKEYLMIYGKQQFLIRLL